MAEAPMLPLLFDSCIPPEKTTRSPRPWLPPSHPLVAALSAVRWPERRKARIELRDAILAEHGAEIDALIRCGEMPIAQVAALMKIGEGGVTQRRTEARRSADPASVRPRGGPRRAVLPSVEERQRLDAIASVRWPTGSKTAKFRAALLKKEFPFVSGLIEAGKFRVRDAAKLFRLYPQKITELRGDLKAGVFDAGAARRVPAADRVYWRDIIRKEFARWPRSDELYAFWRTLRRKYGFLGGLRVVKSALQEPAGKALMSRRVPALPTAAEAERLESIASVRWPRGTDAAGVLRRTLLRDHFGFVFDLIDGRTVAVKQAARLFRVPCLLMTELRSDYRAGTFAHWLKPTPGAEERRKWCDLVRRELKRRPHGETPAEFCRRLRATFGFPLPMNFVNYVLSRERMKNPDGPAKRIGIRHVLRVGLSPAERARLRTIARADWEGAVDPASFRRWLLDAHLDFVSGLISGWKIRASEAAKLFRVSEPYLRGLRKRRVGDTDPAAA